MGEINNSTLFEYYKQELKRISWRIQYRERAKKSREFTIDKDIGSFVTTNFVSNLENRMLVIGMLDKLKSDIGHKIIVGIYLEGRTETELAKTLNMSQQGVNKCKKKMLKELLQMMNSTN